MKLTEHDMLVTLATMALKMDDLTGHDVVEALRAHGYGNVVARARNDSLENQPNQITMTTSEPVGAWRKCQLVFTVPLDSVVVGHELDASEGASILSGLESVRPMLRAHTPYLIRIANGRFEQHVSLTLILEKP